jgi:DNA gyrase subunit A
MNIQPDETVTTMMKVKDFSSASYLFFTTRLGRVKRTSLDQFQSVRSSGLIAIGLELGDELAWVRMTGGADDIVLVSEHGQAIRFHETDARAMGRPAAGVMGIRLAPKDRVIASEVVLPDHDLLVVAAKGLGKRSRVDQFPLQGRGGKGVAAMKLTSRTGPIVAAGMVNSEQAVLMMNTAGIVIRIPAAQIPRIGRATQGVTLMRMAANESVKTMAIVEEKDEADGNGPPGLNGHSIELTVANGPAPQR